MPRKSAENWTAFSAGKQKKKRQLTEEKFKKQNKNK